jgi:catechol 2,3-dioxygenase-like lactoylglutathione lyase family enzyme
MKIEHFGMVVPAPHTMAQWYVDNLGFSIERQAGDNSAGLAFIADSSRQVMVELFARKDLTPLDYASLPPAMVHIAVSSDDPDADIARLQQAGATLVEDNKNSGAADRLAFLRDPWGVVIQLVKRSKPMLV